MPFKFLGDSPLLYTQYRDLGTDRPLYAVPGGDEAHPDGLYDMAPVGHWQLTVPPSDGRWDPPPAAPDPPGEAEQGEEQGEPDGAGEGDGLPPVPLMTGSSTEGEDN